MAKHDLPGLTRLAQHAADLARHEILPRFRDVAVELKADGSPVTEADRAAERAIRAALAEGTPEIPILGEEYGGEQTATGRCWIVDPIDGTISFSRGLPLFGTLIALLEDGVAVIGVIDLPALGERVVAFRGGGCRRNGLPVRTSQSSDLSGALVAHGDVFCFDRADERPAFERMVRELRLLRGYTDAFGHAQVCCGAIDAMVDLDLNPWDMAATQICVTEAGGRFVVTAAHGGKRGLVFGAPALVDSLAGWLAHG